VEVMTSSPHSSEEEEDVAQLAHKKAKILFIHFEQILKIYTMENLLVLQLIVRSYVKNVKVEEEAMAVKEIALIVVVTVSEFNYDKLALEWFNKYKVYVMLVKGKER
jgi:hypothetical protein